MHKTRGRSLACVIVAKPRFFKNAASRSRDGPAGLQTGPADQPVEAGGALWLNAGYRIEDDSLNLETAFHTIEVTP
jgi:hypothetical protein